MAQILKKKNNLLLKRNTIMAVHYGGLGVFILASICCVECWFSDVSNTVTLILALVSIAGLIANDATQNRLGILSSGVSGEKAAINMLAKALPDNYRCITNLRIYYDGRESELDLVVVGDTGVYIVEVKNHKGVISGNYNDYELTQTKRNEIKTLNNPVRQVSTHADRLSRFLRDKGINVWVQGTVFFNNPDAIIEINDIPENGKPIFAANSNGKELLTNYIKTHHRNGISQEQQDAIIAALF